MAFAYQFLIIAPPLLLAVILHEMAHGLAAEKLGDPTARRLGRITLNPVSHIDPVMTIGLPIFLVFVGSPVIFGGAKPVPVDPRYFKNPRRGMAYVALAGPLTNFALAILCLISFKMINVALPIIPIPGFIMGIVLLWLVQGVVINLVLGLFNLLPVPPLDGGRIAVGFLPRDLAITWSRVEPYGILIVFALLYYGVIDFLITPVFKLAEQLIFT